MRGVKPKDLVISEGFNPMKKGAGRKNLTKIRLEKARLEQEEKRKQNQVDKMEKQLAHLKVQLGEVDDGEMPDIPDVETGDVDLDKSSRDSFLMLQDMRAIYRSSGGKRKLKALMKDDKQFMFVVKELIKIEVSLLTARIKAKEEGGGNVQNTVFVVMKGLNDEVEQVGKVTAMDGTVIDMKQIQNAINPDSTIRQEEYEQEQQQEKKVEGPASW